MNRPSLPRSAGPAHPSEETPDHIADEPRRYDDYLRDVPGLAAGTRRGRWRVIACLLRQEFAGRAGSAGCGGISSRPGNTPNLTAHDSAYDRDAPAAGRCRHQRNPALARARKSGNNSPIRRGRPGNERALAKLHEPEARLKRYRAPDALIDLLRGLRLCGGGNPSRPPHTAGWLTIGATPPHN
jgi:hypothetical protein